MAQLKCFLNKWNITVWIHFWSVSMRAQLFLIQFHLQIPRLTARWSWGVRHIGAQRDDVHQGDEGNRHHHLDNQRKEMMLTINFRILIGETCGGAQGLPGSHLWERHCHSWARKPHRETTTCGPHLYAKVVIMITSFKAIIIIIIIRDNNEKFLDAVGIVTGWGRLEYGGCSLSSSLLPSLSPLSSLSL